jgi:hypothetical protein
MRCLERSNGKSGAVMLLLKNVLICANKTDQNVKTIFFEIF